MMMSSNAVERQPRGSDRLVRRRHRSFFKAGRSWHRSKRVVFSIEYRASQRRSVIDALPMTDDRRAGGVTLITGAMAAGKSTVAQALAERLPHSVHVRGDVSRRMIVAGREEMTADPSREAIPQLQLRYDLGVRTSLHYAQEGFEVVYQDIIMGPDLERVVNELGAALRQVVVLCPSPGILAQRDVARNKIGYIGWAPAVLDRQLRETTPRIGLWLDSSGLTVAETVDRILAARTA